MRVALTSCLICFVVLGGPGAFANAQPGVITELLSQAHDECKTAHLMRRKDFEQAKTAYANFKLIKSKIQELDAGLLEGEDEDVIRVLGYCHTVGNDISRSEALPVFQKGVQACRRAATAVQENDLELARQALAEYDDYRERAIEISQAVTKVYSVTSELRRCERVAEQIEILYQASQELDAQIQPTLDYLTQVAMSCPVEGSPAASADDDFEELRQSQPEGTAEATVTPTLTAVLDASAGLEDNNEFLDAGEENKTPQVVEYELLIAAAKQSIMSFQVQLENLRVQVAQAPGLDLLERPEFAQSALLAEVQSAREEITACEDSINNLLTMEMANLDMLIAGQKKQEADRLAALAAEEKAKKAAEALARKMESPEEKRERQEKNIAHYTLVKKVAPEFPKRAIRQARTGYVVVEFVVTTNGEVVDPVVVESQPKKLFNNAALAAVSQWEFEPNFKDGTEPDSAIARTRLSFAGN